MAKAKSAQRQVIESDEETGEDEEMTEPGDNLQGSEEVDTSEEEEQGKTLRISKKRRLQKARRPPSMSMIDCEAEVSGEEEDEEELDRPLEDDWVEVDQIAETEGDKESQLSDGSGGNHAEQLFEERLEEDRAKEDALLEMLRDRQERRSAPLPEQPNQPRRLVQQTLSYPPVDHCSDDVPAIAVNDTVESRNNDGRALHRTQADNVRTLGDYNLQSNFNHVQNNGVHPQASGQSGLMFGDDFDNNPLEDDAMDGYGSQDEYGADSFLDDADKIDPLCEFVHWEKCNEREYENHCDHTPVQCSLVTIAFQIVRTNGGSYELVDAIAVDSRHGSFESQLPQDSEFAPFVRIPRCWLEANWLSGVRTDRARKLAGLACKGKADREYCKQMDVFRRVSNSATNTKRDAFRVLVEVIERLVAWFEHEESHGKPIRPQEGYVC